MKPLSWWSRGLLVVGGLVGLLGCSAERDASFSGHDGLPLTLVTERVTATVRKQAATLVRIETDREVFVTTPEHPFATPEARWLPAGQLAPGDRVVSARFGTARVVAARTEKPSQPVPVFNLTVDRSHAYLVGADQVLVHNTGCNRTQELLDKRNQELSQKESELKALQDNGASSSQQTPENRKKIAELKKEIGKIKKSISGAEKRLTSGVTRVDATTRHTRRLEQIDSELAKLGSELPSSSDTTVIQRRMDDLLKERTAVNKILTTLTGRKRKAAEEASGTVPTAGVKRKRKMDEAMLDARRLQRAWKEYESAKKALEATRRELGELATLPLRTEDERKAAETRKAELEKLLKKQEYDYDAANQVWTWEQEIATINEAQKIDGKRPELEARRGKLRADIDAEKKRTKARRHYRKKQDDYYEKKRDQRQRLTKTVERMRQELAELRGQPDSPSRAERKTHLENAIKTGTDLIEVLRKIQSVYAALSRTRKRRQEQIEKGKDTSAIARTIAQLEQQLALQQAERSRVRAEALLLGLVQAKRRKQLDDDDAAHVQELQGMLADPTTLDPGRLAEIARDTEDTVRGEADVLDDAFFDEIWGSGNHDDAPDAARQDPVPDAFETVDEELLAILHSFQQPDPAAAPEPGSPPSDSGEAGPSNDPAERNTQLRREWQRELEERLQNARDELEVLQMLGDYRLPELEAELLQRIARLEEELKKPPPF
jgi:hypothetical protein